MLAELLQSQFFALFVIISIGITLGRIEFKGIGLDMSAVIFVALLFGHFGIKISKEFQTLGLILFIYSIGIQSGPGFFESFRKHGLRMGILATVLVSAGALTTFLVDLLFNYEPGYAAGLFAGALTSTPGLAAAIESTGSGNASIGYGIAYPFGVIGVILFVNIIPLLVRVDVKKAEEDYENETKANFPELFPKQFVVKNDNIIGKTLAQLNVRAMTGTNISRMKHGDESFIPKPDTIFHNGDIVRAVGTLDALKKVEILIGPETNAEIQLGKMSEIQWVLLTNKEVVNKTLHQLNIFETYNATITRIRRSGIDITPHGSSQLRFGDKLLIACQGNMSEVARLFGNDDKKLSETDILPISIGIVIGIIAGILPIPIPGIEHFTMGLTGGVLLSALIFSKLGKTGPIIWNVSGPANQLLRHLGLLFFLAAVGTEAGANIGNALSGKGLELLLGGVIITIMPMVIAIIVGHWFMRINFLSLLGLITGGMTSTPGLSAAQSLSKSNAATVAYATVYPVALVLMIVFSQLLSGV